MRIASSYIKSICAITAMILAGCNHDCARYSSCIEADFDGPDCVTDPSLGRAEERCGVFVSSSLGSDASPGTRDFPMRTLAQAIAVAQTGPRRVYACAEVFPEPIEVLPGVEIWGGLDCNREWGYVAGKKTSIMPEPDTVPLRFLSGEGKSLVADLRVVAADATQPGGSAIAAIVDPDTSVEIIRSKIIAGDAAAGMPGETGADDPATDGAPGADGAAACTDTVVPGAPAVVIQCDDATSVGGKGGDGDVSSGGDGLNGEPEPLPNPLGRGLGGTGYAGGALCNHGVPGNDGTQGDAGLGAKGPGAFNLSGWTGVKGADGTAGRPGQGGGGGGGSRGGITYCFGPSKGGASGGSGGAGGCGGKGGKGGGYGGASIGVLSLSADVAIRATTIVAGKGGDGGAGGAFQLGGLGGPFGLGGIGVNLSPEGCRGADGGQGGNGGRGGGGLGGPSIGIAYQLAPTQEHVTIQIGEPGKGGAGDPAVAESAGQDGIAAVVVPFPVPSARVIPPNPEP